MVDMKRYTATAVGALMLAAAPMAADALTVTLDSDVAAGIEVTITDGGAGDLDGAANGVITAGGNAAGGFSILSLSASAADLATSSELTQTSLDVSGGGAGEKLTVITSASFTGGSATPDPSAVSYSLGGSELNSTLSGFGTAGAVSTATLAFDPAIDGTDSFSGDTGTSAVLPSPFTMMSTVMVGTVAANKTTSFTATVTAAIPVPAAGLMLLTALGGLGGAAGLRRRRKA